MSAWLIRHRRSVLLLFALVAAAGALDWFRMPVSLFPVIDFPRIVVSVDAGERPVDRMVSDVTRPVEEAVRAVPHVIHVRSTSSRGAAEVSLSFDWGTDMNSALLLTQARLDQVLPSLPPGASFEVRRMDPTVFPVLGMSLTSKKRDLVSLRDFGVYTLRPLLTAIPGVAQIEVLGGAQAEVHVLVDPMKLKARGFGVDDVVAALHGGSAVEAVGRVEDHDKLYLVVADAGLGDLDQVRAVVLPHGAPGTITRIGDVADVKLGTVPQWTRVTANGTEAVLVNIQQQRDGNTLAIADAVARVMAEHEAEIPADVVVTPYYDQGELVRASANSVRDAILIGAVLAALVLFAFLRHVKITLIVAVVLPGVLAATVLVLDRLGMTLNIMTLGGMAAATGLIVDDAVVILEHIGRRLAEPHDPGAAAPGTRPAVVGAALEMLRPLTGSSLATVVVFVPLAFLSGVAGGFFKSLALTIAVALALSYAVALAAVPLLADRLVDAGDVHPPPGRLLTAVHARYERIVRAVLRRKWIALVVAVVVALVGVVCYRAVGQGFLPSIDEGGFVLDYVAPAGMSLSETDRLDRLVEAQLRAVPDVDSWSRRTGLQLGGGLTEANTGDFFIHLKGGSRRPIDEVMSDVRARVEKNVPGLRIETAQLMEDLIGDLTAVPQPVEVKIFGDDERALEAAARAVAQKLSGVAGLVEVFDGITIAGDDVRVHVDPVRAGVDGLDAAAVSGQTGALLDGAPAGDFRQGEKTIGVRVWTPDDERARVDQMGALRLEGDRGQMLPLSRVADVGVELGRAEVTREDLKHMIAVTARLEGRDLASAMVDVKAAVRTVPLPPGTSVGYGGLYAEQQRSLRDLVVVFVSAVVLVTLLLLFLYESWAIVVSILSTTFLSAGAVFAGLWLTGTELNLSSMMGLTMIVGIVTEIAIFFFAELPPGEEPDDEAMVNAGLHRMRPILMTSLVAVLALLPLALGLGQGAQMQAPLAIAIISGIVAAVPLVLVVMPAVHAALVRATLSTRSGSGVRSAP